VAGFGDVVGFAVVVGFAIVADDFFAVDDDTTFVLVDDAALADDILPVFVGRVTGPVVSEGVSETVTFHEYVGPTHTAVPTFKDASQLSSFIDGLTWRKRLAAIPPWTQIVVHVSPFWTTYHFPQFRVVPAATVTPPGGTIGVRVYPSPRSGTEVGSGAGNVPVNAPPWGETQMVLL
jgi:hypothetical protein